MKTKSKPRKWSREIPRTDALRLPPGTLLDRDPKRIALAVKEAAETSEKRRSEPYASAMSYLCFYLNRGGKSLPVKRRRTIEKAKSELRLLFQRS